MIIFDTKGDFYKEFYRPGDVVMVKITKPTTFHLLGEMLKQEE